VVWVRVAAGVGVAYEKAIACGMRRHQCVFSGVAAALADKRSLQGLKQFWKTIRLQNAVEQSAGTAVDMFSSLERGLPWLAVFCTCQSRPRKYIGGMRTIISLRSVGMA
jgi:hypothetical protein